MTTFRKTYIGCRSKLVTAIPCDFPRQDNIIRNQGIGNIVRNTRTNCRSCASDIEIFGKLGIFLNEAEAGLRLVAHQLLHGIIGLGNVTFIDGNPQHRAF